MTDKIRWGILGTGGIAVKFATGLQAMPDAELAAVGSRTQQSADEFADRFGFRRRHASYTGLAADPDVDVIYVATPHPMHIGNVLLCLNGGKAVLCEKPFTVNAAEARQAIDLARARKLFMMEAMWTRYLPALVEVRRLLAEGAIGEVRMISADFGYRAGFDPNRRAFAPELGGGALLDVGVYPISLASMILGTPNRITGMAELGQTGVDEQSAFILGYPGGQLAVLHTAVRTRTPHDAVIMGTDGFIRIHSPWWVPRALTIDKPGQSPQGMAVPFEANGYNYEAAEVHRCLREGRLESAVMPLDETLAIMQTMDTIRGQWGMKYPAE